MADVTCLIPVAQVMPLIARTQSQAICVWATHNMVIPVQCRYVKLNVLSRKKRMLWHMFKPKNYYFNDIVMCLLHFHKV